MDLKSNPEPLRLLSSMRTLTSSLVGNDTAFAMEVSQIYRTTNVKVLRSDQIFMETLNLLEIELSSRATKTKKNARMAVAALPRKGRERTRPSLFAGII